MVHCSPATGRAFKPVNRIASATRVLTLDGTEPIRHPHGSFATAGVAARPGERRS
jgi:hypothetical protein